MTDTTFTARITRIERMKSSAYGNPRFMLTFDTGKSYPTQPDAMLAYGIENPEYRDGPVEVTLNGREHVTYVRPVSAATAVENSDGTVTLVAPEEWSDIDRDTWAGA